MSCSLSAGVIVANGLKRISLEWVLRDAMIISNKILDFLETVSGPRCDLVVRTSSRATWWPAEGLHFVPARVC